MTILTSSKTVIIPITKDNRQGIDDILDAARNLFLGDIKIHEAYIIESADPGVVAFSEALARKSGMLVNGGNNQPKQRKPRKDVAVAAAAEVAP